MSVPYFRVTLLDFNNYRNYRKSMLRAVIYSLMAITNEDSALLPEPARKPDGSALWWVPTAVPDELALVPDFTLSWTKNKPWHKKFVEKVRNQGNALYPSCASAVIAALTDKDILQRGSRTTFKHLKEKYQGQGRSDREKAADSQWKRRDGRKKTVRSSLTFSSMKLMFTS
jgi:hypothetical protein